MRGGNLGYVPSLFAFARDRQLFALPVANRLQRRVATEHICRPIGQCQFPARDGFIPSDRRVVEDARCVGSLVYSFLVAFAR